jgi:hypothetical protein
MHEGQTVKSVKSVIRHYLLYARTLSHLGSYLIQRSVEEQWKITDHTDHTDRSTEIGPVKALRKAPAMPTVNTCADSTLERK